MYAGNHQDSSYLQLELEFGYDLVKNEYCNSIIHSIIVPILGILLQQIAPRPPDFRPRLPAPTPPPTPAPRVPDPLEDFGTFVSVFSKVYADQGEFDLTFSKAIIVAQRYFQPRRS